MSYTIRRPSLEETLELPALEVDAAQAFREVGLDAIADEALAAEDDSDDDGYYAHALRLGRLWVAVDDRDGHLVGFTAAEELDGEAYVAEISVRAAHARRGLGRRLMTALIDWARQQGYREATLTTFRDIPFNGPFYRNLGFREIEPGADRPELAAARQAEKDAGVEIKPRIAMALRLNDGAA